MKYRLLLFLVIFLQILSFFIPHSILADTKTITDNSGLLTISFDDPDNDGRVPPDGPPPDGLVHVVLKDVPNLSNTGADGFRLGVGPTFNLGGGEGLFILDTFSYGDCANGAVSQHNDPWTNETCTGSGPYQVTADIDIKKLLGSNYKDEIGDISFTVVVNDSQDPRPQASFIVAPPKQAPADLFTITQVQPNPAQAGKDSVDITLANTKDADYYYFVQPVHGGPENAHCNGGACTLTGLDIPTDAGDGRTVQITIREGSSDNSDRERTFSLDLARNAVTPTPFPPPCGQLLYQNQNLDADGKPVYDPNNGKCLSFPTAFGRITTDVTTFIPRILGLLLSVTGGIAILIIIRAAVMILTSRGDPEKVQEGKEMLTSAIVGLLFLIFSFVILEVIGVDLLHIPGLGK